MTQQERMVRFFGDCKELYLKKSHDYGNNSFIDLCKKYAFMNALSRMDEKLGRIYNLITKHCGENAVKDEPVEDTLRDLSIYAAMTYCAYQELRQQPIETEAIPQTDSWATQRVISSPINMECGGCNLKTELRERLVGKVVTMFHGTTKSGECRGKYENLHIIGTGKVVEIAYRNNGIYEVAFADCKKQNGTPFADNDGNTDSVRYYNLDTINQMTIYEK